MFQGKSKWVSRVFERSSKKFQVQLGRSTLKLTAVKIKCEVEAEHSILDAVDA